MKNTITYSFLILLISVLASCSSTAPPAGVPNAALAAKVPKPKLKNQKPLTEAEKKALEEADLWVPAAK